MINCRTTKLILIFYIAFTALFFVSRDIDFYISLRYPSAPRYDSFYPPNDRQASEHSRSRASNNCSGSFGFFEHEEVICISNSAAPEYLIIGDSKAMALYSAVEAGYVNIKAVLIAAHACAIFPGLRTEPGAKKQNFGNNCFAFSNSIFEFLNGNKHIKKIILSNRFFEPNFQLSNYFHKGSRVTKKAAFELGYRSLLSGFSGRQVGVYVIADNPWWNSSPIKCFYDSVSLLYPSYPGKCSQDLSVIRSERILWYEEIQNLARSVSATLILVDSLDYLCINLKCSSSYNGKLLYFDRTHLTPYGASMVWHPILERDQL